MQEKYRALLKSGKLTYLLIAVCVIAAAAVVFMPEKKAEVTVPETAETEVTAEAYSTATPRRRTSLSKGRTASRSRWLSRRHSRRSAASSSSAGGAATRRSAKKLRRP